MGGGVIESLPGLADAPQKRVSTPVLPRFAVLAWSVAVASSNGRCVERGFCGRRDRTVFEVGPRGVANRRAVLRVRQPSTCRRSKSRRSEGADRLASLRVVRSWARRTSRCPSSQCPSPRRAVQSSSRRISSLVRYPRLSRNPCMGRRSASMPQATTPRRCVSGLARKEQQGLRADLHRGDKASGV